MAPQQQIPDEAVADMITPTEQPRRDGLARLRSAGNRTDPGSPSSHTAGECHTVRVPILGGTLAATVAGSGEPILLVHGLGGTRRTWQPFLDALASTHTVIAPDLPGHGDSDAPAGDYSLGAHAAALRDLIVALGFGPVTVVGHSLGGGIGLQFAYQFPERTSRLVLISSGGLGDDLTPVLRAATLPGASGVVALLARLPETTTRRFFSATARVGRQGVPEDAGPLAAGLRGLAGTRQRQAFIQTARAVIDWRGQSVSALRQLGLLADLPVLIVWGSADRTIPPHHHPAVAQQLPGARAVELTGAGHYPQETAPDRLLPHLQAFLAETTGFEYEESRWRHLLTAGMIIEPSRLR
jgi:pimeloyl-ACP methyl ester carboxylesterase